MQIDFSFVEHMGDAFLFQDSVQRTRILNERHSEDLRKEISGMLETRNVLIERMKNVISPEEKQSLKERIEHCDRIIRGMRKRRKTCRYTAILCHEVLSKLYDYVGSCFDNQDQQEVTV